MTTHVIRQLIASSKVIQTQEDDIADTAVASTPNIVAVHTGVTNASKAITVKGPGGRIG